MSKKNLFTNPALKTKNSTGKKFNIVAENNSFKTAFDVQKLDVHEEESIKAILERNRSVGDTQVSKAVLEEDFSQLKTITSEIKSISRQGAFLIGERVLKAREILKPYADGTFTAWLEGTFGSRKTGYNMLSYYELYRVLPDESIKTKDKSMSQRAAYSLANRKGEIQRKIEIIDQYFNLDSADLIQLVRDEFSNYDARSRKSVTALVGRLLDVVEQISKKRGRFSKKDIQDLRHAKSKIGEILKKT
jgi:hypothetical protein